MAPLRFAEIRGFVGVAIVAIIFTVVGLSVRGCNVNSEEHQQHLYQLQLQKQRQDDSILAAKIRIDSVATPAKKGKAGKKNSSASKEKNTGKRKSVAKKTQKSHPDRDPLSESL